MQSYLRGRVAPMLVVALAGSLFACSDTVSPNRIKVPSQSASMAAVPASGLVAAYGFDEASGTSAADASGTGNTGTLGSGVTRTTSGKFGSALVFSGNYVTVPNASSLSLTTGMTLEAWVYPTTSGGYATAVMKEQAGEYLYVLYGSAPGAPSGQINVGANGSGERAVDGASALPLNTWSHLATTFDGSTQRLYVNGAQVAAKAVTGSIATSTGALRIGGNAVWGEYFRGRIDEVRIYSRALSAGEIQTDMTTAIGGAPTGDTTAPTVTITAPSSNGTYTTSTSPVTLSGSAADNVGVTQVTWANNRGGSGTATGTTSWSASGIAVQSGTNVITVTARDAANNAATATLTVTMSVAQGPGPVAAYGFNEASGTTTADASGSANTGTLGTGVTRTTAGKFGSSLVFNGSSYVTVPNAASLNLTAAMTLEAWVYPTASGPYATTLMKEQPGDYVYALYGSAPSNPSAEINVSTAHSGERVTTGPSALPLNAWSHLASTFDGSTLRVYVNGAQVASKPFSGPIATSTGALRIGGNAVWGEYFRGSIDEVRIYNRALSAGEITTDMNTAVGGTTPPTDTTVPMISITSPTSSATYATSTTPVTLSGSAADNVAVAQVAWTNSAGGSGTATGTTSWSAPSIALQPGSNIVTVTARDAANNTATATLMVTYTATAPTPTKLTITTQPSASATSGVAFAQQPVIQLRDASNSAVSKSGVVVTAVVASGGGMIGGTTTATTNASGVATFTNLSITGSGAQTLRFSATSLTAVTSSTIKVTTSGGGGTLLFGEKFDDTNFAGRGWYDLPGGGITSLSTTDHAPGSTKSLQVNFSQGGTTPTPGTAARHLFTPSDGVYLKYWIKYSTNWVGSGQTYHPHEFHLITTEDGDYASPAYNHLTMYIEENFQSGGGSPVLETQDAANVDRTRVNQDLTNVTENRAISGCNGSSDGTPDTCYQADGLYYNGKQWRSAQPVFLQTAGPSYKADWHQVSVYFKLNSIVNGKGQLDGIAQYWFDGRLVIDRHNLIFRTGAHPTMKFNQFLMVPYIGDGSPIAQTMWIDDLTVTTAPPSP